MATKKGSTKKATTKKAGSTRSAARATTGAVPPYGVAIREATARGDAAEMRRVAASARKWIKDAQAALEKLEKGLGRLSGK